VSTRSTTIVLRSLTAFSLLLLATLGAGCGGSDETAGNAFLYNEPEDVNSLDPAAINARASWWVGEQIHLGLISLDTAMKPVPRLARSWSVSPDGLVWRFQLRDDVRFADDSCFPGGKGRPVRAEDVRYSFERICDYATASRGTWVFRGKVRGADAFFDGTKSGAADRPKGVEGFRVVDSLTFEIELAQPFAPFLSLLSIPFCYVVPREAVERYGKDFTRHPVGAGPFRLREWVSSQRMALVRNSNYYERDEAGKQLPYLDSVIVSFIREKKSEFSEFDGGRLDMVTTIDPVFLDRVFTPEGKLTPQYAGFGLSVIPSLSVEYYAFMLDTATEGGRTSIFARDARLRQALNYAVDRERIVRYVLKGQGVAATHGPLPPGIPGYSSIQGYNYDPDRARALLAEAGHANGQGIPTLQLQISEGARNLAVAQNVQDQLKAIGLKVEINQVAPPQHREMVASGRLGFWRGNWMADYPDGENFLALFYSGFASPSGANYTHFSSPRFDSLYKAALSPGLSDSARFALYGAAEREVVEQAPWITIYNSTIQRLLRPGITGFTVDPLDRLLLTRVRKQQQSA